MLILLIVLILLLVIVYSFVQRDLYNNSNYKKESNKSYKETTKDKGNYGEYLTFNKLDNIKGYKKILTNVYLPKGNGETTEIDLIFLHETGIYVIESKNYSGWIFGDEKNRYWTQSFQNGKKTRFYNPIMQNKTHIKYLATVLNINEISIKSIITFSERCTLKKVIVESQNIKVINRGNLARAIKVLGEKSKNRLDEGKINKIYNQLKPYTYVSDEIKIKHINNIKSKK